jgi:tetratricopeptide (TPR) repeat protein
MVVALAQAKGVRVMPVPETGEMWSAGTLGKSRAALFAGAGRLLVGSLTREGDSLRVSVSLVDTRENRVIWGDERSGSGGDLSLLAAELVPPLAHELGAKSASGYDYFMYETGPSRLARSLEMTEAMGAVRRYELPQSVEATRLLVERFPREPDARVLRVAALLIDIVAHGPDSSRSSVIAGELEALRRLDPDNPWRDAARALLLPPAAKSIGLLSALLTRNDLTPAARGALLAMRADKFTALGDTLRAITDGEQAVQLDPASDLSLSTLARALTRAGRHGEAALRVRQALALNPTVVNYWLQLGNCMLKLGQWREYVADLEHAAELSPEADAILSAQGDGLSCLGRHRDAADCERRALLRRPERSDYGLHLALSLMRLGKWDEALPLLERACVVGSPAGCSIHAAARAVADYRLGDAAGADEQARLAATMAGSKSAAYALACYHTLRGDREAAIRLLQRFPGERWVEPAIERDPNLALLRPDARFQQVAAWMRAQPIERVFAEWGRSL